MAIAFLSSSSTCRWARLLKLSWMCAGPVHVFPSSVDFQSSIFHPAELVFVPVFGQAGLLDVSGTLGVVQDHGVCGALVVVGEPDVAGDIAIVSFYIPAGYADPQVPVVRPGL